jgi:two-component sensor histidine kinase
VKDALGDRLAALPLADVILVTSELVSNAVQHGSGEIELRLDHDDKTVHGQVIDQGSGFEAEVRERGLTDIGGHGLALVAKLTDRWGVFEGSSHVWFELEARARDTSMAGPEVGDAPPDVP